MGCSLAVGWTVRYRVIIFREKRVTPRGGSSTQLERPVFFFWNCKKREGKWKKRRLYNRHLPIFGIGVCLGVENDDVFIEKFRNTISRRM